MDVSRLEIAQQLTGAGRRKLDELDAAIGGRGPHVVHDGQPSRVAGTNNEPPARPRDGFPRRQGRVPEAALQRAARAFVTCPDLPALDHHVMVVASAVDDDRPEAGVGDIHQINDT